MLPNNYYFYYPMFMQPQVPQVYPFNIYGNQYMNSQIIEPVRTQIFQKQENNFQKSTVPNFIHTTLKVEQSRQYLREQIQRDVPDKAIKRKRGLDACKQLESAKKNAESNLVNQFFSFYSNRGNSGLILNKIVRIIGIDHLKSDKIISVFYKIVRCISSQRGKKYVNKKTLINFFDPTTIQKEIPGIRQKIQGFQFVSISQICAIFRRCCFFYLRNECILSIIQSKRISQGSKKQHLKRRRVIMGSIRQCLNSKKQY